MELTTELKEIYPFRNNYLEIDGHNYHYLDEGDKDKEAIIMVHGNPTWSFYFRNLVMALSPHYRVIVPDHFGCGLSDKVDKSKYNLQERIDNLTALVDSLGLKKYSMIVHDWGGAIGFGHAVDHVENINKMVILNTAAFRSKLIPKTINLCKNSFIGDFIVRYFNAFCYPATFMTTKRKLTPLEKKGYLFPYNGAKNRYAVSEFVRDIPMDEKHRSYKTLKRIEDKLRFLRCPKLILWGGQDFCFNDWFYQKWLDIYPSAKHVYYKDAGHYVIEDKLTDCLNEINMFFEVSE